MTTLWTCSKIHWHCYLWEHFAKNAVHLYEWTQGEPSFLREGSGLRDLPERLQTFYRRTDRRSIKFNGLCNTSCTRPPPAIPPPARTSARPSTIYFLAATMCFFFVSAPRVMLIQGAFVGVRVQNASYLLDTWALCKENTS